MNSRTDRYMEQKSLLGYNSATLEQLRLCIENGYDISISVERAPDKDYKITGKVIGNIIVENGLSPQEAYNEFVSSSGINVGITDAKVMTIDTER